MIPITNTKGQSSGELLRALSSKGVTLNVTAIFTLNQVRAVADALGLDAASTAANVVGAVLKLSLVVAFVLLASRTLYVWSEAPARS